MSDLIAKLRRCGIHDAADQIDRLTAENAALRERLHEAELVAASWKREAELNEQAANESSGYAKRLAEAEALLREALDALPTKSDYESRVQYLRELRDRIDAHLAREEKP